MSASTTTGFVAIGATTINCTQLTHTGGKNVTPKQSGGYQSALGQNSLMAQPVITGTTNDVNALLGAVSVLGTKLSTTAVTSWIQTLSNEGIRSATATKYVPSKGIMVIDSVSLNQGQNASASFTIHPVSTDGVAAPFAITDGSALPTASVTQSVSTLGTVSINTSGMNFVTSVSINLNNNLVAQVSNGLYYPTLVSLMDQNPTVNITTNDTQIARALVGNKIKALDGTNGLQILSYQATNGVLTSSTDNTFQIKNGIVSFSDESFAQGSLGTINLLVSAAWNTPTDASPLLIS